MFMCIDLKSFYASVECKLRHLDIFTTPLVVCDILRSKGAITLAVTPYLKKLGIASRSRAYDLPRDIPIIYARPRMHKYIEASCDVYRCYLNFFSASDIYMYSIDEGFMDLGPYLKYYNMSPLDLARMIKKFVLKETGLVVTIGIGENMFQAKVALDILSKHNAEEIGIVNYENFSETIGNVKPLNKIWCIGDRIMARLNKMGYFCLNDIMDKDKDRLKKEFGLIGLEIFDHARGIDSTKLKEAKNSILVIPKSVQESQILFKDYVKTNARQIVVEMVNELAIKLFNKSLKGDTISLFIGYSNNTCYHMSMRLNKFTNLYTDLYKGFMKIFEYVPDGLIRRVGVSISNICKNHFQMSIFDNLDKREDKVIDSICKIRKVYGKNSLVRAVSLVPDSNQLNRNLMIGGHNA